MSRPRLCSPEPSPAPAPRVSSLAPSRRAFLRAAATLSASASVLALDAPAALVGVARADDGPSGPEPFKLSLSQRSLRREFASGRLDPLDFPRIANGLGLDAVEYCSESLASKPKNKGFLAELKRRAAGEGVWSVLLLLEEDLGLGAPDAKARKRAVDRHRPWLEAAAFLGCHALRVPATSRGSEDEQINWLSDGLRRLCRFSDPYGIDILVENQTGHSAKGGWLAELLTAVGHPRCGSRPDFGSFNLDDGKAYDRYQGVRELMPFARAVSAKAHDFDERGEETRTNFAQMLKVVTDAGYHGYVAIEYAGERLSERAGIARTQQLLERARARLAPRSTGR